MTRATHIHVPSGAAVYPDGYDAGDLEPLAVGYWDAADLAAAWAALRAERDRRLAACDWTQLPDSPETGKAAWGTYRQALRDLPDDTEDPAAPAWPELADN